MEKDIVAIRAKVHLTFPEAWSDVAEMFVPLDLTYAAAVSSHCAFNHTPSHQHPVYRALVRFRLRSPCFDSTVVLSADPFFPLAPMPYSSPRNQRKLSPSLSLLLKILDPSNTWSTSRRREVTSNNRTVSDASLKNDRIPSFLSTRSYHQRRISFVHNRTIVCPQLNRFHWMIIYICICR